MKKILSFNIWTITFAVLIYVASYFLLRDNFLHLSIASIFHESYGLESKEHLIVLGLIPIYIATIIFGTALIGIYFATVIQEACLRVLPKKKSMLRNTPSSL